MYLQGANFQGGDGIVSADVDDTISNVGRLAREGMRNTNSEIIDIMLHEHQTC